MSPLDVITVTLCQRHQALLTVLYRSTGCLRRSGAAVQYLPHSFSRSFALSDTPLYNGTVQSSNVKL